MPLLVLLFSLLLFFPLLLFEVLELLLLVFNAFLYQRLPLKQIRLLLILHIHKTINLQPLPLHLLYQQTVTIDEVGADSAGGRCWECH